MLYRKFLRKKNTIIRCFVWICDLPEIGCPVVKVENLYFQFFWCFTEPILAIFSMLLNSHPTIKCRWKKFCCYWFDAKPQFEWTNSIKLWKLQMREARILLRWLDWIVWGWYLPSLSINYVWMSKDMEKRLPQLYYIKMKICYDLGFIAIGVAMAT